ncbi:MAG: hypothetical protein S4CHLAM6_01940 [Chlamydiae bacterium]|nr:hypothetical protein [Chlamydiota bacterium]
MNVSPVNPSITAIPQVPSSESTSKLHQFPREIAIRLRTLNLLANKVIGETSPIFCKIIHSLDQPKSTVTFLRCEELFEEAFINEFSDDQIDTFLENFFEEFDPDSCFIDYKNITEQAAKSFLWKSIINYLCTEYIGFETQSMDLEEVFDIFVEKFDSNNNIIKMEPSEYRVQLEQHFDQAVNIIPKFTSDEVIQMKLLLINYAALLTSSLKEIEEGHDPKQMLEAGFSIQDLFEEIFFMLLEIPCMSNEETASKLIYHEKLDSLSPEALKKKFLDELVNYLVDDQDPLYEQNSSSVYEALKDCYLLDFELKEILENISTSNIKRM